MTTPRIGVKVRVEIQQTLGSPKTVTNITQANPGVVTSATHGFLNGDVVVIAAKVGMVELDGQACRVANKTADTFELESLNTTNFTAFAADDGDSPPAGMPTATKVSAFVTWSNAATISDPQPAATPIDVSTLLDSDTQIVYGRQAAPNGTVDTIFDPSVVAEAIIKASTPSIPVVFRVTWAAGQKRIFNAHVSGGSGFAQAQNDKATGTCAFSRIKQAMDYTT